MRSFAQRRLSLLSRYRRITLSSKPCANPAPRSGSAGMLLRLPAKRSRSLKRSVREPALLAASVHSRTDIDAWAATRKGDHPSSVEGSELLLGLVVLYDAIAWLLISPPGITLSAAAIVVMGDCCCLF